MKREAIVLNARREGYSIDQVSDPVTVGELIELLENYDEDTLFILSHDNDYTFGSVDIEVRVFTENEDGKFEGSENDESYWY